MELKKLMEHISIIAAIFCRQQDCWENWGIWRNWNWETCWEKRKLLGAKLGALLENR